MYLIQGVFFQNYADLGIAWESEAHGGVHATVRTALAFFVFNGIIGKDLNDPEASLAGEVHDQFGQSLITKINVLEDSFSFTKKYEHHDDGISYIFRKLPNGTWEGGYVGNSDVGRGFARCVLVEVPDDFLIPPAPVIERAKQEYKARRRESDDLYKVQTIPESHNDGM